MTIVLDGKSRRVRNWYKAHVYRMYWFRKCFEQNPQDSRLRHLQNKIDQHMDFGRKLGLSPEEMRNFNLAIIKEMGGRKDLQKKDPPAIIQTLIKENSKKQ